ncbi:hypothetical protein L6164_004467 [Bauhinia variegata]|uniref:Uncharacterized protein n=1 Tax=Bauhinia variegata TaxID=167791 RepID=A0ACB9Q406_BAUVA|nr:hypothetical protein L6164_004467 [Bauhinia variegata]
MADSASGHQFYTAPFGYGAQRHFLPSQFPPKDKEIEVSSDIENSPFKKPRISGTLSNPGMQLLLNNARTRYFKTQLCRNFRLGQCNYGSRCKYAHGIRELERQGVVIGANPLAGTSYSDKKFSKPRRMFSDARRSTDTVEDRCHFLAPRTNNMNSREVSMEKMTDIGLTEHYKDGSGQSECEKVFSDSFDTEVNRKEVLLKTRLCHKWNMKRQCPYGNNCRFAHGLSEIRKLDGYSSAKHRVMLTSTATTNASTAMVANDSLPKEELYGTKCIFKRNALQKISGIYADWIEDVHAFPREVC